MGFISIVLGFLGFTVGLSVGVILGYYLFIYFQPDDVENPVVRPLADQDSETLQHMLPEIPLWVKNPDFDRLDWLNKFLEYMWPFLDKAICKTVQDIAKPIIAEQIPKYKIDSVEFEKLTLGSLPPTFQGMKVFMTDEKELIMETSLKLAANPNITLAIKAFGLKATVQLVDVQVFALPRITLKPLVPSFPCFANILVSLMDKPHVDFGLKVLGADLMSIPGVYGFVQDTIKDQVAGMYLWPKTLEVPILDMSKALRRPVGVLHVKVVRAMKLRKKDLLGSSDPYVKVKLSDDRMPSKKTTVRHKNLNPEWNEEFNLIVKDPESQSLELHVYDWEQVGKHDKMGLCSVPLADLRPDETASLTLDLLKTLDAQNDRSRGQLVVDLLYRPFTEDERAEDEDQSDGGPVQTAPQGTPSGGGLLVVVLHEAHGLEGKHHTNPLACIIFRGEEKRTKGFKKNRSPRWDEEFQFVLEDPPVNDRLHLEVLSTKKANLLHAKESLGYVDIDLGDVVNNKRINGKYNLIESKNGVVQVELQWRTSA